MEMQDMLADRLKQKRALSHASLEEYSKELGISKSALQKYEAGTGNPTLATVQTIADHLHESPAQLLGMYSEEEMEAAGLMFRTLEVVHGAFGGQPQGAGGAVPGTEPFPERRAGRGSRDPERAEGRAMTSG